MPAVHRVKLVHFNDAAIDVLAHQHIHDIAKAVSDVLLAYKPHGFMVDTVDGVKVTACHKCLKPVDWGNCKQLSSRVVYCAPCFLVQEQEIEALAEKLCAPKEHATCH